MQRAQFKTATGGEKKRPKQVGNCATVVAKGFLDIIKRLAKQSLCLRPLYKFKK
jgi:hypothetical protein